jgi:hypothetical protein
MTVESPVKIKSCADQKVKDPSNFRMGLEELSKEELIDRLLNLCQMNGLLGLYILLAIINNHPTNIEEQPRY